MLREVVKQRSSLVILSVMILSAAVAEIFWLDFSTQAGSLPSSRFLLFSYYLPFIAGVVIFVALIPLMVRINGRSSYVEPSHRTFLRYSFGFLWILDGILQMQPGMATGFSNAILSPLVSSSPPFVAYLVGSGISVWNTNPSTFNVLASLLQVYIGAGLILFSDGLFFKLTQVIAIAWGVILWVFGEAFGSVFFNLGTWLTGSPGSALIYTAVSVLLLIRTPRISDSRLMAYSMAIFWAFAGIAQLNPVNGFWQQGAIGAIPLAMSQNTQPALLSSALYSFSVMLSGDPVLWNSILIAAMLAAAVLWYLKPSVAWIYATFLSATTWVLFQGMGIFGGFGTDPNSGLPLLLVSVSYAAFTGTFGAKKMETNTPIIGDKRLASQ